MNNAETMSSGGLITTEDGLEYTVAVNYVAPFTDLEIIASDGAGNPDCEHGFLYVFHREDYSEFFCSWKEEVFGVSLFTVIQNWLCGFYP